jgi:hypothetical protein
MPQSQGWTQCVCSNKLKSIGSLIIVFCKYVYVGSRWGLVRWSFLFLFLFLFCSYRPAVESKYNGSSPGSSYSIVKTEQNLPRSEGEFDTSKLFLVCSQSYFTELALKYLGGQKQLAPNCGRLHPIRQLFFTTNTA